MIVSHLILPRTWEQCELPKGSCDHALHYPEPAETLNSVPLEWTQLFLDDTRITETSIKIFNTNGQLHNFHGPAVEEVDGSKQWWVHGKRHRHQKPAVILADGTEEWWHIGNLVTKPDSYSALNYNHDIMGT